MGDHIPKMLMMSWNEILENTKTEVSMKHKQQGMNLFLYVRAFQKIKVIVKTEIMNAKIIGRKHPFWKKKEMMWSVAAM